MKRLACLLAALGVASSSALAARAADRGIQVPFVGCGADGQMGPLRAPTPAEWAKRIPRAPSGFAKRLAFYAGPDVGVFAPRGWHCFETYGSNGTSLYVTPERHGRDLLNGLATRGPAVIWEGLVGGTSGRFAVAPYVAGLFPKGKAFADGVAAEGEPVTPVTLTAADHILFRSDARVDFVTDAGREGLGTGFLLPARTSVRGVIDYDADDDDSMTIVKVRLRAEDPAFADAIARAAIKRHVEAEP